MKTTSNPVKRTIPDCSLIKHNPNLTSQLLTPQEIKTINAYTHLLDLKKTSRYVNISPGCCLALLGSALLKLEYIHSLK